jgi:hypothetical protein
VAFIDTVKRFAATDEPENESGPNGTPVDVVSTFVVTPAVVVAEGRPLILNDSVPPESAIDGYEAPEKSGTLVVALTRTALKKYTAPGVAPDGFTVNSYSVAVLFDCVKVEVVTPDSLCVPHPRPMLAAQESESESTPVVMTALSTPAPSA